MDSRRLVFEEETIPTSPEQPKAPSSTLNTTEPPPAPQNEQEEETEEQRRIREEEESIELARMMMAEEAALVYHNQLQILRENPEHFSEEDLAVFQALEEQDRLEEERERAAELEVDDDAELSYDALLNLGERIGDVRTERWALVAQQHIDRLPLETYDASSSAADERVVADNDSEVKCLVCQHEYQHQEQLRRLPCGHVFHAECVDEWLQTHDNCLYCRKTIVAGKSD